MRVVVVRARNHSVVGSLRSGEHHPIHLHLILLGLAAEHRMVIENQAARVGTRLVKLVGGNQAGESAADDDQVIGLIDQRRGIDFRLVDPVANTVCRIDDRGDVAVRAAVIADAGVAVPRCGQSLREAGAAAPKRIAPEPTSVAPTKSRRVIGASSPRDRASSCTGRVR